MTLAEIINELTAEDGPNIPLRTLAIYCGVAHSTLSQYKNGKAGISEALEKQVRKGLREMQAEINYILRDV